MRLVEGRTYYTKPWYNSWRGMLSRCYRPKDASYNRYGGRGIRVCEEWHDVREFEKWVEQNPWVEGATIDRIDPDGNYEPNNCRWATMFEQGKNRRNSIVIEWHGAKRNITEWAEITGINRSTLNNRYWRGDRADRLFRRARKYGTLD